MKESDIEVVRECLLLDGQEIRQGLALEALERIETHIATLLEAGDRVEQQLADASYARFIAKKKAETKIAVLQAKVIELESALEAQIMEMYEESGIEYDVEKRIQNGNPHHPKSLLLFDRLSEIDLLYGNDYFNWKVGGEGDNGEVLLCELDILFEERDFLDAAEKNP